MKNDTDAAEEFLGNLPYYVDPSILVDYANHLMNIAGKTTKQAFEQLTNERGWYKKVPGLNSETARNHKFRFNQGKLSLDKIEELLQAAGFKVVQEKLWGK